MGGPEDPGLKPLPGTEISIQPRNGGEPVSTVTNADGFWSVGQLSAAAYDVKASRAGTVFNPPQRQAFLDGEHMSPMLNFFGMPAGNPPPSGDPSGGVEQ
jgi:hypothetical protein